MQVPGIELRLLSLWCTFPCSAGSCSHLSGGKNTKQQQQQHQKNSLTLSGCPIFQKGLSKMSPIFWYVQLVLEGLRWAQHEEMGNGTDRGPQKHSRQHYFVICCAAHPWLYPWADLSDRACVVSEEQALLASLVTSSFRKHERYPACPVRY